MNLHETDAEFMKIFEQFAFDEVVHEEGQELDDQTRYMAILATLIGCQGKEAWKSGHVNRWLAANCFGDYYIREGLALAQCLPYIGYPRSLNVIS